MFRIMLLGLIITAVSCASGCQKSLFGRNLPETPYQRYAELRGQGYTPPPASRRGDTTPEELRQRLAPLEQQ